MSDIQDKIAKAKAAGYSDAEIASHLATSPDYGSKIKEATAAGYKPEEIVSHLSGPKTDADRVASMAASGDKTLGTLKGVAMGIASIGNPIVNAVANQVGKVVPAVGQWNRTRNADLDNVDEQNKDSTGYQIGKVGAQVGMTMPVGGAIAGTVRAVLPAAAALRGAPILNAIASAGMRTGAPAATTLAGKATDLGIRAIGGAVTGGASAALTTPEHAGTGAAVGSAIPVAISTLGAGGKLAAKAWRTMMTSGDVAGAQALAKALGAATPEAQAEIIAKLRGAETMVPDASPTVAQALQTPEAGITNRVVYDSPGGGALRAKIAQQGAARVNALESVAKTDANGFASAREDMGNAITRAVIPEEAAVSKAVSAKYGAVDPAEKEVIALPIKQMQAAVDKYMGRGTFGASNDAATALETAKGLRPAAKVAEAPPKWSLMNSPLRDAAEAPRGAGWDEVSNLRSSINKAVREAKLAGDKQALGALNAQKSALDNAIDTSLSPEAKAQWVDANATHAAKMEQFHTGPQKAIFRTGPDGLPVAEGGEVAAKFWGKGPGAAENVASFRKLIGDNPDLLGQFKSMVTTQGAGTADAAGNLTTKFSKWVDQSLPGLRGAFKPEEVKKLQDIAADIDRNAASMKAGTSLGGSNTYQNSANALDLGMLDSPMLAKAASMVPVLKYISSPVLEGLKGSARNAKAAKLAELLSDSGTAANALERLTRAGATPQQANQILQLLGQGASRSVPVVESR